MATHRSIEVVLAWVAAANSQNLAHLLDLSAPGIALVGPRGVAQGHPSLCDWLARAGLTLTTKRVFARDQKVVLAQHGVWRNPTDGSGLGEADVASLFQVAQALVTHFARYDDLATALAAAGLNEADEVTPSDQ